MSVDRGYFWVVLCKNHRFHHKGNHSYAHEIALGETDARSPRPLLTQEVSVRCDHCGSEYSYRPREIVRSVIEVPVGFVPHPLFRESANDLRRAEITNRMHLLTDPNRNLESKHGALDPLQLLV
jgi:hypothetical protein